MAADVRYTPLGLNDAGGERDVFVEPKRMGMG